MRVEMPPPSPCLFDYQEGNKIWTNGHRFCVVEQMKISLPQHDEECPTCQRRPLPDFLVSTRRATAHHARDDKLWFQGHQYTDDKSGRWQHVSDSCATCLKRSSH